MPPRTLTRRQFKRTAIGRQPGSSYSKYLGYLDRKRDERDRQVAPDLFAPLTRTQFSRQVAEDAAAFAPTSPKALRRQVTQDVSAATRPVAAQLEGSITRAATAGSRNIMGVTDELARNLAAGQDTQRDIFDRARSSLSQLDAAVSGRLGAAGGELAGDVRQRLEAAGLPAAAADTLAAQARGAAGAGYARGSAETAGLAQQQAGAESYAAQLPAFARLSGLQAVAQRRAQGQQDIADQVGGIKAQVPGLIAQGLGEARGHELQKATARSQVLSNARRTEFDKGIARLGFKGDIADIRAETKEAAAKRRADAQKAAVAARAKSAEARRPNATLSGKYGYIVDSTGRAILGGNGKPMPVAKTSTAKPKNLRLPNPTLSGKYGYIVDSYGKPILQDGKRVPVAKTAKGKGKGADLRLPDPSLSRVYGYIVDSTGRAITTRGKPRKDEGAKVPPKRKRIRIAETSEGSNKRGGIRLEGR